MLSGYSTYQTNPSHVGTPVRHWCAVRDEGAAGQCVQRGQDSVIQVLCVALQLAGLL